MGNGESFSVGAMSTTTVQLERKRRLLPPAPPSPEMPQLQRQ
jgi:hypothetical protein